MIARHALVILLGSLSGCAWTRSGSPRAASKYSLLNPLLAGDDAVEFTELRPFDYKIKELVEECKKAGLATHVSVYFRDLESGPLFGLRFR